MFKQLFERFGFFSHEKLDSKKEVEPNIKNIIEPDTTQIVDDLPIGYYHTSMGSYGISRKDGNQEEIIKSLIQRYRRMEMIDTVDEAIDIIIDEMIIPDEGGDVINIELKKCELPEGVKDKIIASFDKILFLLNFSKDSRDICRKWYVDGRIHYNVVIEKERPAKGIKKLVYIDAMDVFPHREMAQDPNKYRYFYNVFNRDMNKNVDTHPDFVAYCGSGKFDRLDGVNPVELSYLHKAFKPMNRLTNIEDSIVIYRLIRASDRRVFTVNTGMLNKKSSEEYMQKLINKFKNKLVYNVETGEVDTYKNIHSMVEDFWFAENSQGKGTKLSVIEGGQGLKELDDLYYFKDAFYDALKIPQSRRNLERDREKGMYSTTTEIERDEITFHKMIKGIRKQFSQLFIEILRRELTWTKVLSNSDFDKIKNNIEFTYNNDNLYEEMKESAIMNSRITNLQMIEPYIGRFYTNDEIAYQILKFSEDEWKEKQKDFKKNKKLYDTMSNEEEKFSNFGNQNQKEKSQDKEEDSLIDKEDEEENKKEEE